MKEKAQYIASKARQIFGGTLSVNQYKDYVLALLFLKSASECYKSNYTISQDDGKLPLRLIVSERSSFDYLCNEISSPMLGKLINTALYELEQANSFVAEGYEINKAIDFESNILGEANERLSKLRELLQFFDYLKLTDDEGKLIDVGFLYNQLLYIFAEEAGKRLNNVLAPKEVVGLVSGLIDEKENASLYDPASGNGTLLVEAAKRLGSKGANIFGQEANWNMYALTKMNLMLDGFKNSTFLWGDSLSKPKLIGDKGGVKQFDVVVSVPPFADKWAAEEAYDDPFRRFKYGIPPKSQATWAYISHILASLQDKGQAVVVVPVGVLFRNSESKIREQIIESNLLEAVIELPPNLFHGTAISTAILVFRNNRERTRTLFADARNGSISSKGINKLSDVMTEQLLEVYKGFLDGDTVCRDDGCPAFIATQEEIRNNKYDLKVSRYVEETMERKEIDVEATLQRIEELEKRERSINTQMKDCIQKIIELTKDK